jgi:hypothetical protein
VAAVSRHSGIAGLITDDFVVMFSGFCFHYFPGHNFSSESKTRSVQNGFSF